MCRHCSGSTLSRSSARLGAAWLTTATVVNATSNGYQVIWSIDGEYYLDALNEVWQVRAAAAKRLWWGHGYCCGVGAHVTAATYRVLRHTM